MSEDGSVAVRVPFGGFAQINLPKDDPAAPVLRASGARYDAKSGSWRVPATLSNAARLNETGAFAQIDVVGPPRDTTLQNELLFPYQLEAAQRLAAAPHGQLLCLSPGLGKTVVAVVAADHAVPPHERVVVVAPASLLRTWEREVKRWSRDPRTYVMTGKVDAEAAHAARWIIVSWDKASRTGRDDWDWGPGWPLWIMDESVLVKSRDTRRFRVLSKVRKGIDRVWLLSGSPTTRYADDLWTQMHLVWPAAFPAYWRFADRYCVIEDGVWAKTVVANKPQIDAARDNADMMIVVNQRDVLALPEYLYEPVVEVELVGAQRREYERMKDEFLAELSDGSELVAENEATRLMYLLHMASYFDGQSAKRDALVELLPMYEPPYLVWTHWRDSSQDMSEALRAAGVDTALVNGGTDERARDAAIEAYKAGKVSALVMSMGVGKFGHTLTSTKTISFLDKNYNADDYFQALHRVRRIGLDHSPVVLPIRALRTVDKLADDNVQAKLNGISRMTRSQLADLLRGLGR